MKPKNSSQKKYKHSRQTVSRRIKKNRSVRRKGPLLTLYITLLLICVITGVFFYVRYRLVNDSAFTLRHISIKNNRTISDTTIMQLSGISFGKNIFNIDLADVKKSLQKYYLIRYSTIKRELPDTIDIIIHERFAVARIASTEHAFTLDEDTMVLNEIPIEKDSILPLITGFTKGTISIGEKLSKPEIVRVLELIELCYESTLKDFVTIKELDISEPRNIRMTTANGTTINMGIESFEERISKLIAIYQDSQKKDLRMRSIDLRYNSVPIRFEKKEN